MMKKHGIACRFITIAIAAALILPGLAGITANAAGNIPYDINFSLGSNQTQMNFSWLTPSTSSVPQVQILTLSQYNNDGSSFPSSSTVYGTVSAAYYDATDNSVNPATTSNMASGEYQNQAYVTGLTPSTKYIYRVGDGTTYSQTYSFTTGNPANGFTFAAFGDPQIGAFDSNSNSPEAHNSVFDDQTGWANTLSLVTSNFPSINFFLTVGDEIDNQNSTIQSTITNPYGGTETGLAYEQQEYQMFFNPSASANYLQSYPLAAVEGNHDQAFGTYYSAHYNHPNLSTLGQTQTNNVNDNDGDYWFRYGNTLFMVLNANDATDVTSHSNFMAAAIAANPGVTWKVCSWHQSVYSEANHAYGSSDTPTILMMRQKWTALMDQYGVDVVLSGHDHSYTRSFQMYGDTPVNTVKTNSVTNPQGTVYFTLDSGSGSKYYSLNPSADATFESVFWQGYVPSYSIVSISNTTFSIATFRTDNEASIDTYTITKTASENVSSSAGNSVTSSINSNTGSSNPQTGDTSAKGLNASEISMIAGILLLLAVAASTFFARKRKTISTK